MNEIATALSVLTGALALLTTFWKIFQRVDLILKKVDDNTRLTDQTKLIASESSEKIKVDMEHQFIGLQKFHQERYRELNKGVHDATIQIEGLKQRITKLEHDLREHLNESKSDQS